MNKERRIGLNIIQDIIMTNKNLVPKSIKSIMRNWRIILVGIVYVILSGVMWRVAANAWILGGIITALFQGAIISNYLYLIENIIKYEKFTLDDFKNGFTIYLRKIYILLIIFWFVRYGFSLFLRPVFYTRVGPVTLWFLVQLAALILLNPLPEVIYQKHYDPSYTLSYSFEFIKENWLEWFIPNGFILGIIYLIYFLINNFINFTPMAMANSNFIVFTLFRYLIYIVVYQLILSFAMIYRGHLFNILSTSTRRKRMFMRNMYK
jgi:hypothetical protein